MKSNIKEIHIEGVDNGYVLRIVAMKDGDEVAVHLIVPDKEKLYEILLRTIRESA